MVFFGDITFSYFKGIPREDFKFLFNNYKVDDVLVIGSYNQHKTLTKECKNARLGTIIHCSPFNQSNEKYFKSWILYDDSTIEKMEEKELTSFIHFECLDFVE